MKQIITRDIYFLFSRKNWLLLMTLLITISVPLVFIGISNEDYLYTVLGMNLKILDKRYIMIIFIVNFYMLWLGNILLTKDLKYSCEFLWLRMKTKYWLVYKYSSVFLIFCLINTIIGLSVAIYGPICQTNIFTFIWTIFITSTIQLFVTTFFLVGVNYFKKGMMYIIVAMYIGAIYLNIPGLDILFTSTILDNPPKIIIILLLVGFIAYFIKSKLLFIIEGSVKHD